MARVKCKNLGFRGLMTNALLRLSVMAAALIAETKVLTAAMTRFS